jgi:hypothetical protein
VTKTIKKIAPPVRCARVSGQQDSAPEKKLFGYESFVAFHNGSTFITSS